MSASNPMSASKRSPDVASALGPVAGVSGGEPVYRSAGDLAVAVRCGGVSAVEVTEAHLARIEALDQRTNAVCVVDRPGALAAAAVVDEVVLRGGDAGPLAGVPVTVKEAFEVAGLPGNCGMPNRRGHVAGADAPAVARLRTAGAVVLGKTNVPTQLADLQCANPVYGRTVNPWDPERTCGGSSGGSAVAIAAGFSAVDLGSDLSGSIRVPAAWCGVAGLRPSPGLVPKLGHLPWPVDDLVDPPFSVAGPLARCVADLRLAFGVLAGPTGPAGRVWSLRRDNTPPADAPPRLAVWSEPAAAPVSSEVATVFDGARRAVEAAGAVTFDLVPPVAAEDVLALAWRLVDAEISYGLDQDQWESRTGAPQTVRSWWGDVQAQQAMTAAFDDALVGVDGVLCPAVAVCAPRHDERPPLQRRIDIEGTLHPHSVLAAWSLLTSLPQMPSVTLPAGLGTVERLPVGIQVAGRPFSDMATLAVAAWVEQVLGGFTVPPGW